MLIALGVTGGIGAYKAVEVARGLQKRGHDVVAVMTRSATPLRRPGDLRGDHPAAGDHRSVRARRERRHRAHRAGDRRSTCCSSRRRRPTSSASSPTASPTISCRRSTWRRARRCCIAPAMNTQHARARGRAAEPGDAGGARRALRRAGRGLPGVRLDRQGPARRAGGDRRRRPNGACGPAGSLRGQRVVVTAGPTYEDIDPVRYIGNRSSGRMGYAIAAEAARRGAHVMLVAGPTSARGAGRCARSCACAARPRCTRAMRAHAPAADVVDHGGGRGRLHAGRGARRQQDREDATVR